MGELVRRLDYEKRSNDVVKQKTKSKFRTREYSLSVKAANDLASRIMKEQITRAEKSTKTNQFKHDRDLDFMNEFRKTLTVKSIDFDPVEFHKNRKVKRKLPKVELSNVNKILKEVPSNSVLDFGPGNKVMHTFGSKMKRTGFSGKGYTNSNYGRNERISSKLSWQNKTIKSSYAKYFRSKSAIPVSDMPQIQSANERTRPRTAKGIITAETEPSPRVLQTRSITVKMPSTLRPTSASSWGKDSIIGMDEEGFECVSEGDGVFEDDIKSKSYRTLKDMFTFKSETETVLPDPKFEFYKRCVTRENTYSKLLRKRVQEFSNHLHH